MGPGSSNCVNGLAFRIEHPIVSNGGLILSRAVSGPDPDEPRYDEPQILREVGGSVRVSWSPKDYVVLSPALVAEVLGEPCFLIPEDRCKAILELAERVYSKHRQKVEDIRASQAMAIYTRYVDDALGALDEHRS